jgi:hypothetical protein
MFTDNIDLIFSNSFSSQIKLAGTAISQYNQEQEITFACAYVPFKRHRVVTALNNVTN